MNIDMAGAKGRATYAYTGGKTFDAARPAVVFIHGAEHDHSVWALQTRYFAHHGFGVLALDLPGHGRTGGPALSTIGALADWVIAVLDAVRVQKALFVGHSMGSLIALDAAARHPARAMGLALLATAAPMHVSDTLLDAAREHEPEAIDMVNQWSHSTIAAKPSSPAPGFWLQGVNQRLMERVSLRGEAQLFHTDFSACNSYADALERAAAVRCPVCVVSGRRDAMTPPRAARPLVDALRQTGAAVQTVELDAGHALMSEQPDATLDALFAFALGCAKA
ncbi:MULTISPECIES: alpha/beta fold hydrolase [Caballeronia]|uniref:alpha/beta fold hydrolase n=1 Tax=Caballeronia TaxID=1827195 RepID=UPI0003011679|nr:MULTISPECIES: alpha/beta hydrolase [unclassified Caballeronia]MCE4542156.1 alpha/beta hydrolase [Caballeronia sp. PC1]MCE4568797.1 alpha/beta hydrolase [Caballeronia sp. CLC5]BAO86072.1 alpha/beta hydrolase fold protein [Burkholderia sp. RPE67]